MGDLAASHQITDLATKRTEIKEDECEEKSTSGLVGSKRKTVNKALPHLPVGMSLLRIMRDH